MRKLIDIGDKKLEIFIKGEGNQTIVIQTGMASPMYDWLEIIDEISKDNKVIAVHRAGCGRSELGTGPWNTTENAKDLKNLLEKLQVTEPIILVGHSYGGLCTQHFSKAYPEKIIGVVLVDSCSVDVYKFEELELSCNEGKGSEEEWIKKWEKYSNMTTEELIEEVKPKLSSKQLKLSKEIQNELLDFYVNPSIYKSLASELKNWHKDGNEIKELNKFPSVPLKVLLRDPEFSINSEVEGGIPKSEAKILEDLWQELVKEQTKLSEKSELIIAEGSGHCIYEQRPDAVIEAIKKVIMEVNN